MLAKGGMILLNTSPKGNRVLYYFDNKVRHQILRACGYRFNGKDVCAGESASLFALNSTTESTTLKSPPPAGVIVSTGQCPSGRLGGGG